LLVLKQKKSVTLLKMSMASQTHLPR